MMAKFYSIACIHRRDCKCLHPDRPHGDKPSPGVCARACKLYDGPPVIESTPPLPIPDEYEGTSESATRGGCGCKK